MRKMQQRLDARMILPTHMECDAIEDMRNLLEEILPVGQRAEAFAELRRELVEMGFAGHVIDRIFRGDWSWLPQ